MTRNRAVSALGEADYELTSFTCEFADPEIEEAYQYAAWPDVLQRLQTAVLLCMTAYLTVAVSNYLFLGFSKAFLIILSFRLFCAFCGFVVWRLARRGRAGVAAAIVVCELAVTVTELVEVLVKVKGQDFSTPFAIGIVLFYYFFVPNKLVYTVWVAVISSVLHVICVIYLVGAPLGHALSVSIAFVLSNFMGIYFVRTMNGHLRKEYINTLRLRAAKEAAEAGARAKARFLATMSHELRTPMNGVLGMIRLLQETSLEKEQQEYAEAAYKSGKLLLGIIDEILDFSRIDTGNLDIRREEVALGALLNEARDFVAHRADEKGLELELNIDNDIPLNVISDRSRLRQILLNLLDNAVKFTESGRIVIRVELREKKLRFIVTDTGIGIEPEARTRIFEEFVQADPSIVSTYGGTGLGLAISRRLVRLMGGTIGVDSEAGRGSSFWFEIPLETRQKIPAVVLPSTVNARVMVVEDNVVNQEIVKRMLRTRFSDVTVVSDGESALKALDQSDYDLILMDIQMPGMDGIEVARQVRGRNDEKASTPIIALTANVTSGVRERCFAVGMNGFVVKPSTSSSLYLEIARVLGLESDSLSVATAPDDKDMSDPSILDWKRFGHLQSLLTRDEFTSLLSLFTRKGREMTARIYVAAREEDLPVVSKQAHDLRSAALDLGLNSLAGLMKDIEEECLAGRQEKVVSQIEKLPFIFSEALAAVDSASTGVTFSGKSRILVNSDNK